MVFRARNCTLVEGFPHHTSGLPLQQKGMDAEWYLA